MHLRTSLLIIALALVSSSSPSVGAQLYRWTDAQGTVHYTDTLPKDAGIVAKPVPGTEREPEPAEAEATPPPPAAIAEPAATPLLYNAGSVTGIPVDVLGAVASLARQKHPGDQAAQALFVRQQLDAYRELQHYGPSDIPHQALLEMFRRARLEYPADYAGQKYSVDVQVAAWRQGKSAGDLSATTAPEQDAGSSSVSESTTVIHSYPDYYPGYPHRPNRPGPAAQQPYIIYHPGPNAPKVGPQQKPVILMPPGWTPLEESPESPAPTRPRPRPASRPASKSAGAGASSGP